MPDLIKQVTIAGLLHDIGKVLHRANTDGRAHSLSGTDWVRKYTDDNTLLECIRYHHHQELASAGLPADHPAYVVYLADNISSGTDRREVEGTEAGGFDKNRSPESIYNLLNNSSDKAVYRVAPISEEINYPSAEVDAKNLQSAYQHIIFDLEDGLRHINLQEEYVNSLLELCEAYLSYIPSSTYRGEVSDISLYDHSKITAAIAACLVLYMQNQDQTDYRREFFTNRHDFYQEKAFCLFSCDISGIQSFIYNISSKGALKGLRARSFYLELLLENLVDEILASCSLYRTNLLYTGGGHAYLLLPNTETAQKSAAEAVNNTNGRLLEWFGSRLYISYGLQDCSANELMNHTQDPEAYSNLFRNLSVEVAERKMRRYSADDLRQLNDQPTDQQGRECGVCGVSAHLEERNGDTLCHNCATFNDISSMLIKPDTVLVVSADKVAQTSLPLVSSQGKHLHACAMKTAETKKLLQDDTSAIVRVYSKNTFRTGFSLATKLWLGDYAMQNEQGDLKTFSELAASSSGIDRIGVLRADVDDMGSAFVNGFIREHSGEDKYRYLTISRTTTLSRSLSIFFKYYLNTLLTNGIYDLLAPSGPRNIVVVYSGGDDLFLVGAWNEVLAAAIDIRQAFARYSGNTLTISGGLAIFPANYPISRMAAETARLEESAKKHHYNNGNKNSISLFGFEYVQTDRQESKESTDHSESHQQWLLQALHTYNWDTFIDQVLEEKFGTIKALFSSAADYGNSFLYNIMALLRQAKHEPINIARLAYLLARHEPPKNAADPIKEAYSSFTENVYQWALNEEDRRQLITAIMLYVYYHREKGEENRE